jgi:cytochrome c biogenesis protein CcmG/thiol:disulfide interchange protein DsbE
MAGSHLNDGPEGTGGLPVGRLATDRDGTGRPAGPSPRRAWSSALPLIILALVAGLGIGLAIGLLVGGSDQEAVAPTTSAAVTSTLPSGSTAVTTTSTTSGGTATTAPAVPAGAYGVVTISGDALPALETGGVDTALGLPIPEISGVDFDDNPQAITANGKGKLIIALAHWCPHCNDELPVLRDWYATADLPAGIEVFSLTVFTDPSRANYPPGSWLRDAGWNLPVLADDEIGSIANALGIRAVPFNLLVTPEGTVAARVTGGLSAEQLDGAVEYLVGVETTTTP